MTIIEKIRTFDIVDIVNTLIKTPADEKLKYLEKKDEEVEEVLSDIKSSYPNMPFHKKPRNGTIEENKIYEGRIKLIMIQRSINKLKGSTRRSIKKKYDIKDLKGLDHRSVVRECITLDISKRKEYIKNKIDEVTRVIKENDFENKVYQKVYLQEDVFIWDIPPLEFQTAMSLKGALDFLMRAKNDVRYYRAKKIDFRFLWTGSKVQLLELYDNLNNEGMIVFMNKDDFIKHFKFDQFEKLDLEDLPVPIIWNAKITLLANLIGRLFNQSRVIPLLDDFEVWENTNHNFSKLHFKLLNKKYLISRWSMQKLKGKKYKWGLSLDDAQRIDFIIENTYNKK